GSAARAPAARARRRRAGAARAPRPGHGGRDRQRPRRPAVRRAARPVAGRGQEPRIQLPSCRRPDGRDHPRRRPGRVHPRRRGAGAPGVPGPTTAARERRWRYALMKKPAPKISRKTVARRGSAPRRAAVESSNALALVQVFDALARARSADEAVTAALDAVRSAFGWAYGSFWRHDPRDNALRFALESGTVNA